MSDLSKRATNREHPSRWLLVRLTGLCVIAVASATLISCLGGIHWMADLFSHWRVQYCLILLAAAGLLLLIRSRQLLALSVVCLAFNAIPVLPYIIDFDFNRKQVPDDVSVIRLMSVNVLTSNHEFESVRDLIRRYDPDFIVLMETNGQWQSELKELSPRYPHAKFVHQPGNFGIAFLAKTHWRNLEVIYSPPLGLPSLVVEMDVLESSMNSEVRLFQIIATHPIPPVGVKQTHARNDQLIFMAGQARDDVPALIVGDLNVTPWSHQFKKVLAKARMTDSAPGYGAWPTWNVSLSFLGGLKVDHVLVNEKVRVLRHRVLGDVGSDHRPILVDFLAVPTDENGD